MFDLKDPKDPKDLKEPNNIKDLKDLKDPARALYCCLVRRYMCDSIGLSF